MRAAHTEAASIDVRALPVLLDAAQERGGRRLPAALLLQPLLAEQPADLGGMRRRLPRCRGAEVPRCRGAEVPRCRGAEVQGAQGAAEGAEGAGGAEGAAGSDDPEGGGVCGGRREGLRPRAAEARRKGEQVSVHAGPPPVVSDEHATGGRQQTPRQP